MPRLLVLAVLVLLALTSPSRAQTIDAIRERGFLICASVAPLGGFAQQDGEGRWAGFDVDICRALAAAVFGDPNMLEFRPLRGESRFAPLQTGEVDIMIRNAPWTQRRDTVYGSRFVTPTFYDGQAFLVPQSLGIVSAYEMDELDICVADSTEQLSRLREFFFATQAQFRAVVYESVPDLAAAYRAGLCNGLSASGRELNAVRRDLPTPADHIILPERISKEVLGPVVPADDDLWFNIVRWTIFALINAEELGVTAANVDSLVTSRTPAVRRLLGLERDFGAPLGLPPGFMVDAIRAVGNYGDIYERNFGPPSGIAMLRGQNSLWHNGGLLFAPPIR